MTARVVPDPRDLRRLLDEEQRTVALANGCFDILHVGHVRLLAEGARHADRLVVALNSDTSVRRNKGEGRPFVPLAERMEVIAALGMVDYVTSFDEPTAHELIEMLRPEVHIKGTDWTADTVPERETVERLGGRVVICGDPKSHSSTDLGR